MINAHIFRQYDIRGIVGGDIDGEVASALGRAFGTVVRRRNEGKQARVALGRDNRLTSESLAAAYRDGLVSAGVDVVDVGLVPTPVLYFAEHYFETDAATQITGSHNPPEYNGFKLSVGGAAIYGDAIQDLRRMIDAGDFEEGSGSCVSSPVLPIYTDFVSRRFPIQRPVKVVVDCGNGTGSVVAVDLLRAVGEDVEVIPLFCESDGTFPNHHPDPVVDANLIDLQARVLETGANLGIAFDGDADRIGVVDETGAIVRGDTLLLIFALDLLERRGAGQKIVFDVKCSQALPQVIEAAGGVPIMSATGHSLIKERMRTEGALLAGELSGHICFAEDYFGFDDALYAACLIVSLVSRTVAPLSEIVAAFPKFVSTPELRYAVPEEEKFALMARAVEDFSRKYEVVRVDGARVLFNDGWGLLRASNTEPVIVGRFEAENEEALRRIRATMEDWLARNGVEVT